MNDTGFFLFVEYKDKFRRLSDAQLGQLIRVLLEYKMTGEEPEIEDIAVGMAFDVVRLDIDKQAENYRKRAEAGRKGGQSQIQEEATESNAKQTEANESIEKQNEANESIKKENKKEKEKYIKEKTRKEKSPDVAVATLAAPDDVKSRLQGFVNMRRQIKKPMTGHAVDLLYGRLCDLSVDPGIQCAILDQSIRNSWQDVYPLKNDKQSNRAAPKQNQFNSFALQQDYDMEAIEAAILAQGG